ncbi:MAG: hypothetical protein M1542_01500 [Thermotogae bacterium]|jgi:hypothetical protein|nr:hypothetical protein [Thermotogota bacterium]MCL5031912.1 hypothetical protein [Thermotogota bacterium]
MNELESVKEWYIISRDSNYEISRLIAESGSVFSNETIFYTIPVTEIVKDLKIVREEIDDFAILSMVAVFEQKLVSILEDVYAGIRENQEGLKSDLLEFFHEKALKRWHFEDILELFKDFVNDELFDQIKSIYKYRNWVAHGKYTEKPTSLDPITVYEKLSNFLETINEK